MAKNSQRSGREKLKRNAKEKGNDFLVVGIGASAGGIKPLEQFLERMPADAGMALVVILHLSPEHESNLAPLLQRKTNMPVEVVVEPLEVMPNCVYVIPPGKHLVMNDGHIQLAEPEQTRGVRVPIDLFLRTLAEAYSVRAVGIILSGTGTDGTLGLRRIKEEGGVSIAQDPLQCEYDGMPRSAINSGLVDFVLPVTDIPQKLLTLRDASAKIEIWPEGEHIPQGRDAEALREVLSFVRARTGHDFSNYKKSTVLRRVARRLQVNHIESLRKYLSYLREHPAEPQELLRDLLISVTNFFRDSGAFAALESQVIPKLIRRDDSQPVRIWVTGCATGEEAYSLAILLLEYADSHNIAPNIQIFATDIDSYAISNAREGLFPDSIEADVSAQRLKRFFTREDDHYRVKKEVRETVLFAQHNVLRDPPFSKLDLVSCRNLLIYLNRETQERVLELFHFALLRDGHLLLGASESAENLAELFAAVDKKHRIYKRRSVRSGRPYVPEMPVPGRSELKIPDLVPSEKKASTYSELHQALLEQYAPPSVVLNSDYDIVHLSDSVGRFLRFAGGEPSRNLLKVAHPDLRIELRAALFEAAHHNRTSEVRGVRVGMDGTKHLVNIVVRPIHRPESLSGFLLVTFEQDQPAAAVDEAKPEADAAPGRDETIIRRLEEELTRTKSQLHATVEQYETSTEELRASNEELQAINEELRSTTEELETSKEELQSLNEELTTVNYELKDKVDEVSRFNSDLQNLMASTDIGTIFLNRELRITRFTPRAQDLFNIIQSDVDRPFTHLTHKLEYNSLPEDAEQVLRQLTKVEREVRSASGRWYIARLVPYRTMEDRIDGVVLTFVDITDRKLAEEEHDRLLGEIQIGRGRLEMILKQMPAGLMIFEAPSGKLLLANKEVDRIWKKRAIHIPTIDEFTKYYRTFHSEGGEYAIEETPIYRTLRTGEAVENKEVIFLRGDGSRGAMNVSAAPIRDVSGEVSAVVVTFYDISGRKQAEDALRRGRDDLEKRVRERTNELELITKALQADIEKRRKAEEQVTALLRRIVGMQEAERGRLARDLHDQLGQQLTAIGISLESAKQQAQSQPGLLEQISRIQAMTQQLDSDVDALTWEIHPAPLDELGLVKALGAFVEEWSRHFGIEAKFLSSGLAGMTLPPEAETSLYRITQEALNNIVKHAAASRVDVLLERRDNELLLVIEDNGKGFEITDTTFEGKSLGLISMKERAAVVGGTLDIESKPQKGTAIFARVPISGEKQKNLS